MANFPCVHHIEIGAVDGSETVNILTSKFSFQVKAIRQTEVANQWLVTKNNIKFVITTLKSHDVKAIKVTFNIFFFKCINQHIYCILSYRSYIWWFGHHHGHCTKSHDVKAIKVTFNIFFFKCINQHIYCILSYISYIWWFGHHHCHCAKSFRNWVKIIKCRFFSVYS
jgi:hypothetical protein